MFTFAIVVIVFASLGIAGLFVQSATKKISPSGFLVGMISAGVYLSAGIVLLNVK